MILPYPAAYVKNGIILFYFTDKNTVDKKYKFVFDRELNSVFCVFGDFGVPIDLIENLELIKNQTTIYFMRYDFQNVVAEYIGSFTIDEQFIIDMKVQLKLLEMQQSTLEPEPTKNSTYKLN